MTKEQMKSFREKQHQLYLKELERKKMIDDMCKKGDSINEIDQKLRENDYEILFRREKATCVRNGANIIDKK